MVKSLVLTHKYAETDSLLRNNAFVDSLVEKRFKFYSATLNNNWLAADNLCKNNSSILDENRKAWEQLLKRQASLKDKSPVAAMIMSVIIPGAGKIYTDDWKDGVVAMLIIGSLGYESYEGFHTKGTRSVLGYIFGAMTIGYYAGNIYGSYQSAVRYNFRKKIEIHESAEKLVVSGF